MKSQIRGQGARLQTGGRSFHSLHSLSIRLRIRGVRSASGFQNVRHGSLELFCKLSSTSGKDSRRIVTLATCAGNVVGNRFQRTGRGNPDESTS